MISTKTSSRDADGQSSSDGSLYAQDRRLAPRILVNLEVDYGNKDNFLFAYIKDISTTGIFVRTNSPEEPGTHLNVRFTPISSGDVLDIEGEVIWINPFRPGHSDNLNPGMGIRFIELTESQRRRLTEFVTTFAYLSDDDRNSF